MMSHCFRCIVMGAAGRDFHDFQTFFRQHPEMKVCAFTATQIPFIETRVFPKSLAGPNYDEDVPIYSEEKLPQLIEEYKVDFVFLSYSDLSHMEVMHKASLVQSCGAGFVLLSPKQTQLRSSKPVIAIVAVRTGAGKSPLSQFLARYLVDRGKQVGVIRHPMPYGNLLEQQVEKFSSAEDLDRYRCTVEEREEYQPYVDQGLTIFAGVDYAKILDCAEQESDVILWDGGNNDFSFIRPDLSIVVTDALRSGHETTYYPGETNFLSADIVVINKVSHAKPEDVRSIRTRIAQSNPDAKVIEADLDIHVEQPELLEGKKAIVVEDGPTLTHGGMAYGAGFLVAKATKGLEIIDPRPFAVGTIKDAYEKYPHMDRVLPALGYSSEQCGELSETINSSGADVVIDASPARLEPILELQIPLVRVSYRFQQISGTPVEELVAAFLES